MKNLIFMLFLFESFLLISCGTSGTTTGTDAHETDVKKSDTTISDSAKDTFETTCTDQDNDGYYKEANCGTEVDCDDTNSAVHPKAEEICGNKIDEDCSGSDKECPKVCTDSDKDGYYKESDCGTAVDCDDLNNTIHPNAKEICGNKIDEDCDSKDEECKPVCMDSDGDGYGYGDGCKGADCNDTNKNVNPGMKEICGNGIDENCDNTDEKCPVECVDNDKDGFGVGKDCTIQDCNDSDPDINPEAEDICGNNKDEDCDGADKKCGCVDKDGDTFGEGTDCKGPDCDDNNKNIYPGAEETCGNNVDEDCNGSDLACPPECTDKDGDGYGEGKDCKGADCDDNNKDINPGAEEICGNGKDEDCSGADLECPVQKCTKDSECKAEQLCNFGTGKCIDPKVWEWYAPVIYLDTDEGNPDLDYFTSLNYDGDWILNNNAENVSKTKKAYVYYSFVKTDTHWYIGYHLYFPKRWSKWWEIGVSEYENTMRGILLVVERNATTFGKPVLMELTVEGNILCYAASGASLTGGIKTSAGKIKFDVSGHRIVVYADSRSHNLSGDKDWDKNGFPGENGVIYRYGGVAEAPLSITDDNVYYDMPSMKEYIWNKKEEIGATSVFSEFGLFASDESSSEYSAAPWRYMDEILTAPYGEFLFDPATMVTSHFTNGWGVFESKYTYNPYAIRIDVIDYGIYVTADPFGGYADPYLRILMKDGSGWEYAVLDKSGARQKNWMKNDVPPYTILDMKKELVRYYFYGLAHPDYMYFGIESKDADGVADDWLMDGSQKEEYTFTGEDLLSWGKSDATIKVTLP
jgi:hypothetical protein